MDTIKINCSNVKMVAHRGVSGLETENTCAAFVAAGNRSYYGIECDVHVTSDGRFAVIHDDNTARVCAENYTVEDTPYEVLRSLRLYDMTLKEKKSELLRADCVIPELKDYISICRKYGKVAVLELKNPMAEDDVCRIAETIDEMDYLNGTVFISFAWDNLVYLRKHYPDTRVQFLTSKLDNGLVERLAENRFDLDIHYSAVSGELVSLIHEKGLEINCWTVDDPETAQRMIECGVDYITTNILE